MLHPRMNGSAHRFPNGVRAQSFGDDTLPAQNPTVTAVQPISTGLGIYAALATVSMAASAYHGYKRDQSIGWALVWGALGALFPVITPTIAIAQGFGKRAPGR